MMKTCKMAVIARRNDEAICRTSRNIKILELSKNGTDCIAALAMTALN